MNATTSRTLVVLLVGSLLLASLMLWLASGPLRGQAARTPLPEPPTHELSVLYDAPDFTLTDQRGEPFDSESLAGKVWVADFIFTRCRGICPRLTAGMAELRQQLQGVAGWDEVRLVSISVDPDHDRPAVLQAHSERYEADPAHWTFLTTDPAERPALWNMIEQGFKLPVSEQLENEMMPFGHSPKFVLVDRQGQIRGYFDGLNPDDRTELVAAVQTLLAEPATQ